MRLLIWLTQSSCGGENCHQILNTKLAPAKFEMLAVKEGRRGPAWTAVAVDLLSESFTTNITVRGFSSILTIWSFPIAGCRRRKERERESEENERNKTETEWEVAASSVYGGGGKTLPADHWALHWKLTFFYSLTLFLSFCSVQFCSAQFGSVLSACLTRS